ncbi:hypothetical protein BDQ17DRAFT_1435248 [Cyathus striatus]|nr:hypothetical protein BDQ17DRAFT_1435248 [Cyathus striatus]
MPPCTAKPKKGSATEIANRSEDIDQPLIPVKHGHNATDFNESDAEDDQPHPAKSKQRKLYQLNWNNAKVDLIPTCVQPGRESCPELPGGPGMPHKNHTEGEIKKLNDQYKKKEMEMELLEMQIAQWKAQEVKHARMKVMNQQQNEVSTTVEDVSQLIHVPNTLSEDVVSAIASQTPIHKDIEGQRGSKGSKKEVQQSHGLTGIDLAAFTQACTSLPDHFNNQSHPDKCPAAEDSDNGGLNEEDAYSGPYIADKEKDVEVDGLPTKFANFMAEIDAFLNCPALWDVVPQKMGSKTGLYITDEGTDVEVDGPTKLANFVAEAYDRVQEAQSNIGSKALEVIRSFFEQPEFWALRTNRPALFGVPVDSQFTADPNDPKFQPGKDVFQSPFMIATMKPMWKLIASTDYSGLPECYKYPIGLIVLAAAAVECAFRCYITGAYKPQGLFSNDNIKKMVQEYMTTTTTLTPTAIQHLHNVALQVIQDLEPEEQQC